MSTPTLRPTTPSPLRLARLRAGFTLSALAAQIGSSQATLSKLERGDLVKPDLEKKIRAYLAQRRAS